MNILSQYIEFVLHLNTHLGALVQTYGGWIYAMVFLIIFCETGLIITPFLPGESLLFALGTIAATGALNVNGLAVLCIIAAILGGFINYAVGSTLGHRIAVNSKFKWFHKYIDRTHRFYEKHGAFTIVIARLIPIVRTYAPFVAGLVRMDFLLFCIFNIVGGVAWIVFFIYLSYFFGNIPVIKQHFSLIILSIIAISVIPIAIEIFHFFFKGKKSHGH